MNRDMKKNKFEEIEDKISGGISIFVFVMLIIASAVGFFAYNIPVIKALLKGLLSMIGG